MPSLSVSYRYVLSLPGISSLGSEQADRTSTGNLQAKRFHSRDHLVRETLTTGFGAALLAEIGVLVPAAKSLSVSSYTLDIHQEEISTYTHHFESGLFAT